MSSNDPITTSSEEEVIWASESPILVDDCEAEWNDAELRAFDDSSRNAFGESRGVIQAARSEARPASAGGRAADRRDAAGAACGRKPADLLESNRKFVESLEEKNFQIKPSRCRCRFCSVCCLPLGLKLKDRLLPVLKSFKSLMMWTLTVDPKLFESPEAAFKYLRENRCVAEWVRSLRVRNLLHTNRYFCVVEWQMGKGEKAGTEMVHFHVLLDAGFIEHKTALELWGRFRPSDAAAVEPGRPAFGTVLYSKRPFENSEHAANYACKYLTKPPEKGYPEWVMQSRGEIKRYSVSKGFWESTETNANEVEKTETKKPESVEQLQRRTIAERVASCGEGCIVLKKREVIHSSDNDTTPELHFVCKFPFPLATVLDILKIDEANPGKIFVSGSELLKLRKELVKRESERNRTTVVEQTERIHREKNERYRGGDTAGRTVYEAGISATHGAAGSGVAGTETPGLAGDQDGQAGLLRRGNGDRLPTRAVA